MRHTLVKFGIHEALWDQILAAIEKRQTLHDSVQFTAETIRIGDWEFQRLPRGTDISQKVGDCDVLLTPAIVATCCTTFPNATAWVTSYNADSDSAPTFFVRSVNDVEIGNLVRPVLDIIATTPPN